MKILNSKILMMAACMVAHVSNLLGGGATSTKKQPAPAAKVQPAVAPVAAKTPTSGAVAQPQGTQPKPAAAQASTVQQAQTTQPATAIVPQQAQTAQAVPVATPTQPSPQTTAAAPQKNNKTIREILNPLRAHPKYQELKTQHAALKADIKATIKSLKSKHHEVVKKLKASHQQKKVAIDKALKVSTAAVQQGK